jgi:hypothetical protein
MILAYLLLLTGLTISAVAIYYSVVGLTAIFSAAVIPIIIMGSALEVGKLVCASWLKANWEKIPRFMKIYMSIAVVVLMLITSMGIFGFLSKAHNDQNLVSGDVQSKIAIFDEKIKTARENIEADRKQLKQMDDAVDQIMARSTSEGGADKANAVRKSQQKDRISLARDIESQQKLIADLNDQAAPIRAEVRKVDAEVGPIKYIAAFIYGANPDASLLEQAVTWIIILIVVVFDPLAVIMLLASQMTFGWAREQKESTWINDQAEELTEASNSPAYEPDDGPLTADQTKQINETVEIVTGTPEVQEKPEATIEETELDKWNKMIEEAERQLTQETVESTVEERVARGETYIDTDGNEIPVDISEDSKKKDLYDQGSGRERNNQEPRVAYVQNAEQNTSTLWAKVNARAGRPVDRLYKEWNEHQFKDFIVDKESNPKLHNFVEYIKKRGTSFADFSEEDIKLFEEQLYELRKNNSYNPA